MLTATILALVDEGDEVVTLEPFYDSYGAAIALGKATHRTVALRAPHVGTLVRLAPAGSAVAVGEAYGALAVLDEERPLLAEQAGTIVEHRRAAGVLIEHGEELALIAA